MTSVRFIVSPPKPHSVPASPRTPLSPTRSNRPCEDPPSAQCNVPVDLAAALEQPARVRELGASRQPQLHSRLAQDQRAHHAAVTRAIAVSDYRRRGIGGLFDVGQQAVDQCPRAGKERLHLAGIGLEQLLDGCRWGRPLSNQILARGWAAQRSGRTKEPTAPTSRYTDVPELSSGAEMWRNSASVQPEFEEDAQCTLNGETF